MLDGFMVSRWRFPQTITIIGELPRTSVQDVADTLRDSRNVLGLQLLGDLHFLRAFAVHAGTDLRGRVLPARLVISVVFEGPLDEFVDAWIQESGERLTTILSHCTDYPQMAPKSALRTWIFEHVAHPQTYHIGLLRDELKHVREEDQFQSEIQSYLDERPKMENETPKEICDDVRRFVDSRPDLPQGPRPETTWGVRVLELIDVFRVAFLLIFLPVLVTVLIPPARQSWWAFFLILAAVAVGLISLWILVIRLFEIFEGDTVIKPKPGQVAKLVDDEDRCVQNQFTMLTLVRDSWFRRINLRFVLWLANAASRHYYRRGQLVGIDTIHFARFQLLDDGRRLLFMSDFDGGWERYLFDFLGVGSFTVIPIWTNLHGCPKTLFLRWPTKRFAQRFVPFTRADQVETHLWYSAIEHLTVIEIKRNAQIRKKLFQDLSSSEITNWLKLF